jgi:hypothetical protein
LGLLSGLSVITAAVVVETLQMDGTAWVRNILLTSVIFCGPLFIMFCVNNTVAIIYRVRCIGMLPLALFAPLQTVQGSTHAYFGMPWHAYG